MHYWYGDSFVEIQQPYSSWDPNSVITKYNLDSEIWKLIYGYVNYSIHIRLCFHIFENVDRKKSVCITVSHFKPLFRPIICLENRSDFWISIQVNAKNRPNKSIDLCNVCHIKPQKNHIIIHNTHFPIVLQRYTCYHIDIVLFLVTVRFAISLTYVLVTPVPSVTEQSIRKIRNTFRNYTQNINRPFCIC